MSNITQYEGILSEVDENGNVIEMYPLVHTDPDLKKAGRPADAAAVDNICTELRNSIIEAVNIAKGRNQAVVYETYADMIDAVSKMDDTILKRGYNIYIATPSVPDLWVYTVESEFVEYDTSSVYDYAPYLDSEGFAIFSDSEAGIGLLEDINYISRSYVCEVSEESEVLYKDENGNYVRYNSELGVELVAGSDKYVARDVVCYTFSILDETISEQLKENAFIQIGYYKVAQLETQKVDLTTITKKLTANNGMAFRFTYDETTGKYGYIVTDSAGADTFVPFRDLVADTPATATAAMITEGFTAWVNGELITGTRPAPSKMQTGEFSFSSASYETITKTVYFDPEFDTKPEVTYTLSGERMSMQSVEVYTTHVIFKILHSHGNDHHRGTIVWTATVK